MADLLIGGVMYAPASAGALTIEYDLYMQRVLENSGIRGLAESAAGYSPEDLGNAALRRLLASGETYALLAGLVRPKDEPWSPRWAERTAEVFRGLTDQQDRTLLGQMLVEGLTAFFRVGPRSSLTSH